MLKRQTVTREVTDILRQRIIRSLYKGGDQIRQEALATELGVSRIPVREALLQLEGEGLVINHPHKGAVVASQTTEDATEIFDARALLEPFLLGKAMARYNAPDILEARTSLGEYEKALRHHAAPEELSRLNWAFHVSLCSPAGRPRSMAILSSLHNSADRYLRLQIDSESAQRRAFEEHRTIFAAYEAGNVRGTCKLLKDHILDAANEVLEQLRQRPLAAGQPGLQ